MAAASYLLASESEDSVPEVGIADEAFVEVHEVLENNLCTVAMLAYDERVAEHGRAAAINVAESFMGVNNCGYQQTSFLYFYQLPVN